MTAGHLRQMLPTVLAALLASSALAATPPTRQRQEAAVLALLDAPHPRVNAADLRRIGPDVAAIVRRHATRDLLSSRRQVRALALLGHLPGPATTRLLHRYSDAIKLPVRVRRVAIRALASAVGRAAIDMLIPLLGAPDLHIREATVYGLGDIGARRVESLLRARARRETEPTVKRAIAAVLAARAARRNHRRRGGR